ncbi:MAG: hypothetical protein P1V81_14930 [Planctomycetota bacterium]|nr:hypothetical protein [Planctomycetota bacterium]
MPVAEEVHFLYPESEWALSRLQDDPGHLLFKRFGESVPPEDWNEGGTKQGIYMMGPNGEYLEGLHAASGSADRMVRRLERALERWKQLAESEDYADLPVPPGEAVAPPEVEAAPLVLRVSLRDLPRDENAKAGRRFSAADQRGRHWMDFTKWAWNQNWLTLEDPAALVPGASTAERELPVPAEVVERISRHALIDNVRGQNPAWPGSALEQAELTMAVLSEADGLATIEYRGQVRLRTESQRYEPRLYGRAVWNRNEQRFESFQLVAIGERQGSARFNQRSKDQGPAPMGIVLDLF